MTGSTAARRRYRTGQVAVLATRRSKVCCSRCNLVTVETGGGIRVTWIGNGMRSCANRYINSAIYMLGRDDEAGIAGIHMRMTACARSGRGETVMSTVWRREAMTGAAPLQITGLPPLRRLVAAAAQ